MLLIIEERKNVESEREWAPSQFPFGGIQMFIDTLGNSMLDSKALVIEQKKNGKDSICIWWNKVNAKRLAVYQFNEAIENLENRLTYKTTKEGCRTIATVAGLVGSFFIREVSSDTVEICGIKESKNGEDIIVFRYCLVKSDEGEMEAYLAWNMFRDFVLEFCGQSLSTIFGGLPQEFHKYRGCVPSPINWCNDLFVSEVIEGCVKADICSAYGTEASKTLPDLHANARKVVSGKALPTKEYPFAFYLESGEMAIWGEGSSEEYKNTRYMKGTTEWADKERTLLCKAAKVSLAPVFEYLYSNRKDFEEFKFVMNATIGMFHRKRYTGEQDNLWPLAAVIKFRCNKRIIDLCRELLEKGQVPLLINTDSIAWFGRDTSLAATGKKLGNFTLEYDNCAIVYNGPKAYQVKTPTETLTRWSGPHKKKYTEKLAFGAILEEETKKMIAEQEAKNIYKWDWLSHRYINKLGTPITKEDIV